MEKQNIAIMQRSLTLVDIIDFFSTEWYQRYRYKKTSPWHANKEENIPGSLTFIDIITDKLIPTSSYIATECRAYMYIYSAYKYTYLYI